MADTGKIKLSLSLLAAMGLGMPTGAVARQWEEENTPTKRYTSSIITRGSNKTGDSKSEERYQRQLEQIESNRETLSQRYKTAKTKDRKLLLAESREYITEQMLETILPARLDIGWILGKEAVTVGDRKYITNCHQRKNPYSNQTNSLEDDICTNCSLYVADVLLDAGFRFTRGGKTGIGGQLAVDIIRTFSEKREISWFNTTSNLEESLNHLVTQVKSKEPGMYIVGLDRHVGFLVYGQPLDSSRKKREKEVYFCHAAYYENYLQVMCEKADTSGILYHSRIKVIGRILG